MISRPTLHQNCPVYKIKKDETDDMSIYGRGKQL
jgi:hypothetical protein